MLIYSIVFIALFLGCMAQSAVGFGSMLIAMPLLTFVLPLELAAPVLALIGPPTTIYIFHLNRHGVDWREVARIMAGALAGVPLGLWRSKVSIPRGSCGLWARCSWRTWFMWRPLNRDSGPGRTCGQAISRRA